jgi:hypothetical protein
MKVVRFGGAESNPLVRDATDTVDVVGHPIDGGEFHDWNLALYLSAKALNRRRKHLLKELAVERNPVVHGGRDGGYAGWRSNHARRQVNHARRLSHAAERR